MDAISSDLSGAAAAATARLAADSYRVAAGGAGGNPPRAAAMAGVAREAIFADALLSAMHARLEELKSATK